MVAVTMGYFSGALFILTVLLQFHEYVSSGSTCYELQYSYSYYGYSNSYYSYYGYCSAGCCGYTTSRYCCTSYNLYSTYYDNNDGVIGVIVGSTVGSGAFFVMMVTGICCACKKINKNKVNRVIEGPASTGPQGVAIVNNRMNIPMQQQMPGQMHGYLPQGYPAPQALTPQAYPPPVYHSTAPIIQPGISSEPIAQSSNIPSAWNNAEPIYHSTAPILQPGISSEPIAQSSNIPSAWNNAEPATTQEKH